MTTTTGIKLAANGDIEVTDGKHVGWVSGDEAIAQMMGCRLRLLEGENILDQTSGLNFAAVTGAGVTKSQIEAEVRREVSRVPGVVQVAEVAVSDNTASRAATVEVKAAGDTGRLISSGEIPV